MNFFHCSVKWDLFARMYSLYRPLIFWWSTLSLKACSHRDKRCAALCFWHPLFTERKTKSIYMLLNCLYSICVCHQVIVLYNSCSSGHVNKSMNLIRSPMWTHLKTEIKTYKEKAFCISPGPAICVCVAAIASSGGALCCLCWLCLCFEGEYKYEYYLIRYRLPI